MKTLFNAHTHIFDFKCVPNRMSDKWYLKWFSINKTLALGIGKRVAAMFGNNMRASRINRALNFVGIGMNSNQEEIFDMLQKCYADMGDIRFVILPMDMEFMGGGPVTKPYLQQLGDLVRLRSRYPDKMLPFLGIHADRFRSAPECLSFVQQYIGPGKPFIGIKMYPATGYYPDDPRLMDMYKFAEDNQVPITTHCTKGPTHYLGKIPPYDAKSPNPKFYHPFYFTPKGAPYYLNAKSTNDFQENWSQPVIFRECVLNRFKDLKVNLAHFGGASRMAIYCKNPAQCPPTNWYKIIRDMLADKANYPNVYTDISYTLTKDNIMDGLLKDIRDPAINDRILFGTDFYVVAVERGELIIKENFVKRLNNTQLLERIASDNVRQFLTSKFFTPAGT